MQGKGRAGGQLELDDDELSTCIYNRPFQAAMGEGGDDASLDAGREPTGTLKISEGELEELLRRLDSDGGAGHAHPSASSPMEANTGSFEVVLDDEGVRLSPQVQARASTPMGRRPGRTKWLVFTGMLAATALGLTVLGSAGDEHAVQPPRADLGQRAKPETVLPVAVVGPVVTELPVVAAASASPVNDSHAVVPVQIASASAPSPERAADPDLAVAGDPDLAVAGDPDLAVAGDPDLAVAGDPGADLAVAEERGSRAVRQPLGTGILRLNARPWAEVHIDGKPVGHTPQMNLRLTAGWHRVMLKNPENSAVKTFTIKIAPGKVETRILDL